MEVFQLVWSNFTLLSLFIITKKEAKYKMKNMKKIFLSIGAFLCIIQTAYPESINLGDYKYSINEKDRTASFEGPVKRDSIRIVNIPETITYNGNIYTITSIGANAFFAYTELQSVTIPKTVSRIGSYAFHSCWSLKDINLPDELQYIGQSAFCSCLLIKFITIPEGVMTIENEAFEGCWNLERVELPKGLKKIEERAFSNCTNLSQINIPDGVTSIGNDAFYRCGGGQSLYIPASVINLGTSCFSSCANLTSIVVDSNNPSYCSVNGILFNKTQTQLLQYPANKNGYSYQIPDKVTTIADYAFSSCKNLSEISYSSNLKSIGTFAFYNSSLRSVHIASHILSIGYSAFHDCQNLTDISVDNNNPAYCSIDGVLFNKSKTRLITYPAGKQNAVYAIPGSVTEIESGALGSNTNLQSVIIPDNVTAIPTFCFDGCEKLANIIFPSQLQEINYRAFAKCTSIKEISLPDQVTTIDGYAFSGCENLSVVTLPPDIKNVHKDAFDDCKHLKEFNYPQGFDISKLELRSSICSAYALGNMPHREQDVNHSNGYNVTYQTNSFPLLTIVDGTFSFSEQSNNKCIDANEQCAIKFKIKNNGKGAAQNCEARVKLSGTTSGISVQTVKLPSIAVGQTYDVNIPVSSNANTQDGNVIMSVQIYEPNGWGVAPFDVEVLTKAFVSPLVQIVDYNITSPSGKVHRMEPFTIAFTLQNIKYGDAENVNLKIITPQNVIIMEGSANLSFPLIKSGEKKSAQIVLAVNNNYEGSSIPVTYDIKEKYGKYAENKNLNIELVQATPSIQKLTVKEEKTTYKIVSYKEMALTIAETPRVGVLTNTSVAILRPEWFNKYNNPQNVKSPFPYAAIKLELKGDKEAIDVAKERLSLTIGGKHIVEAKDVKETNMIWFLVHCRNEYIDLDCGDGCEPINIWKERLEPNRVYKSEIRIEVK